MLVDGNLDVSLSRKYRDLPAIWDNKNFTASLIEF